MRKAGFLILIFLFANSCMGQEQDAQFWEDYDQARLYIAKNNPVKALQILTELHKQDSIEPNVHYLVGVAHVLKKTEGNLAIHHLQKAEKRVSHLIDNLGVGPAEHVYYFLIVAYSREHRCDEALQAFESFTLLLEKSEDAHLVKDGKRWVDLCQEPTVDVLQVKDRLKRVNKDVKTRIHRYSTRSTLYGVQVAALLEPKLARTFLGVKNVEVYTDLTGIFRYVIGNFIYRSQAEKMLKIVSEAGYDKAFIVDITNTDKFGLEVLTVDGVGVKEEIHGKVEYFVQVAAFAEPLSDEVANYYLMLDNLVALDHNGLTTLNVAAGLSFGKAIEFRDEIRLKGYVDAFVVAISSGRRISIEDARKHQLKVFGQPSDNDVLLPKNE